jgi:hypothetical protein
MANTSWSTTDRLNVTVGGTGNLTVTNATAAGGVRTIDRNNTGKFYFEYTCTTWPNNVAIGIANIYTVLSTVAFPGSGQNAVLLNNSGSIAVNGVGSSFGIPAIANGSVVCVALDLTNRLIWFRNGAAGNWNGGAANNPVTGTGGVDISPVFSTAFPAFGLICATATSSTLNITANFGDTAFVGTAPSGFTAGFTSGATFPTYEIVTQVSIEEWASAVARTTLTQIGVEEWAAAAAPNIQLTQTAIEEWATVATLATAVNTSQLVRTTLLTSPGIANFGALAIETLLASVTRVEQSNLIRETLVSSASSTQINQAAAIRETLLTPTLSIMSVSLRESLINPATPPPTRGIVSKEVRETLMYPFSRVAIGLSTREALFLQGPARLLTSLVPREALLTFPATMRLSDVIRETLLPETATMISLFVMEKLRYGKTLLGIAPLTRESLIRDPVPLPAAKRRKAWVWVNAWVAPSSA